MTAQNILILNVLLMLVFVEAILASRYREDSHGCFAELSCGSKIQ